MRVVFVLMGVIILITGLFTSIHFYTRDAPDPYTVSITKVTLDDGGTEYRESYKCARGTLVQVSETRNMICEDNSNKLSYSIFVFWLFSIIAALAFFIAWNDFLSTRNS